MMSRNNWWNVNFVTFLVFFFWRFSICRSFQVQSVQNESLRRRTNRKPIHFHGAEQSAFGVESEEDDRINTRKETKIFLDISVKDQPIGRLVFCIPTNPSPLPLRTENLIQLLKKTQVSIDPRCSYVGCEFRYSPQFIENRPQYRWSHVIDGKGHNAVGKPTETLIDTDEKMRLCTHSAFGGVYYGINYDHVPLSNDGEEEGVVLTVPLTGPGRGSSSFSIVRVGASPMEWKERLLINSAILGWLEEGTEVLHFLARQTYAPPIISDTGTVSS